MTMKTSLTHIDFCLLITHALSVLCQITVLMAHSLQITNTTSGWNRTFMHTFSSASLHTACSSSNSLYLMQQLSMVGGFFLVLHEGDRWLPCEELTRPQAELKRKSDFQAKAKTCFESHSLRSNGGGKTRDKTKNVLIYFAVFGLQQCLLFTVWISKFEDVGSFYIRDCRKVIGAGRAGWTLCFSFKIMDPNLNLNI